MLSRTVSLDRLERLAEFLTNAKSRLSDTNLAGVAAYRIVETVATQAFERQVLRGRPTSLMSKFVFTCQAKVLVRMTAGGRNAFRTQKLPVKAHDYVGYIDAFAKSVTDYNLRLRVSGLSAAQIRHRGKEMPPDLFLMRASDKWLMLIGGFNVATMEKRLADLGRGVRLPNER